MYSLILPEEGEGNFHNKSDGDAYWNKFEKGSKHLITRIHFCSVMEVSVHP